MPEPEGEELEDESEDTQIEEGKIGKSEKEKGEKGLHLLMQKPLAASAAVHVQARVRGMRARWRTWNEQGRLRDAGAKGPPGAESAEGRRPSEGDGRRRLGPRRKVGARGTKGAQQGASVRVSGSATAIDSPVLTALRLSAACRKLSMCAAHEPALSSALGTAAAQLELIATAALDVTAFAAKDAAEAEEENDARAALLQRLGRWDPIIPTSIPTPMPASATAVAAPWPLASDAAADALAHFLDGGIAFAVEHRCTALLASPHVVSAVADAFLPSPASPAALRRAASRAAVDAPALLTLGLNVLLLPLLPLVSGRQEDGMRRHAIATLRAGRAAPYVLWVLPGGRFALWLMSTTLLALCTSCNPPPSPHPAHAAPHILDFLILYCPPRLNLPPPRRALPMLLLILDFLILY